MASDEPALAACHSLPDEPAIGRGEDGGSRRSVVPPVPLVGGVLDWMLCWPPMTSDLNIE